MSVQEFIDGLGLDLAMEIVGENPDLPEDLAPYADSHYRLDILRYAPYRHEHFVLSCNHPPEFVDPQDILYGLSRQIRIYREVGEPSAWCAYAGLPDLPSVHEKWHTFARDEEKLRRLFSEDFDRFLALDPRRQE